MREGGDASAHSHPFGPADRYVIRSGRQQRIERKVKPWLEVRLPT